MPLFPRMPLACWHCLPSPPDYNFALTPPCQQSKDIAFRYYPVKPSGLTAIHSLLSFQAVYLLHALVHMCTSKRFIRYIPAPLHMCTSKRFIRYIHAPLHMWYFQAVYPLYTCAFAHVASPSGLSATCACQADYPVQAVQTLSGSPAIRRLSRWSCKRPIRWQLHQ